MEDAPILALFEEFEERFPSEDDCVEGLYSCLIDGDAVCRHCLSSSTSRALGSRVIDCLCCGKRTWFTAGTFFERIRSVRPWLLAMWILERGGALSASVLKRLCIPDQTGRAFQIKTATHSDSIRPPAKRRSVKLSY